MDPKAQPLGTAHQNTVQEMGNWKRLLRKMATNTLIYSILCAAVTTLMLTFFLPFARHLLPHWWANGLCGVLTLAVISPFLRSLIMKNNRSEEFKAYG
jgi:CPA2 family monovalent cation:H+ antiporter-2